MLSHGLDVHDFVRPSRVLVHVAAVTGGMLATQSPTPRMTHEYHFQNFHHSLRMFPPRFLRGTAYGCGVRACLDGSSLATNGRAGLSAELHFVLKHRKHPANENHRLYVSQEAPYHQEFAVSTHGPLPASKKHPNVSYVAALPCSSDHLRPPRPT